MLNCLFHFEIKISPLTIVFPGFSTKEADVLFLLHLLDHKKHDIIKLTFKAHSAIFEKGGAYCKSKMKHKAVSRNTIDRSISGVSPKLDSQ